MEKSDAIVVPGARAGENVDGLTALLRAQPLSDVNTVKLLGDVEAHREKTKNVSIGEYNLATV